MAATPLSPPNSDQLRRTMTHWYTADTHFNYAAIIRHCNRPHRDPARSVPFGSDEPVTAVQNQSGTKEDEGAAVRVERFMLWRLQNAAAIADDNAMIQKFEIPLSDFGSSKM